MTIYDKEKFRELIKNMSEEDSSFIADLLMLKDHQNKTGQKFTIAQVAYVYLSFFHKDVFDFIYKIDEPIEVGSE